MPTAVNTDTHTQALRVTSTPRRFYGRITSDIFDENNLLLRKTNTIILGDPGAGKTTTLKRLIRSVIYINNDNDESNFDLPILIVARDLGERETLNSRIFDILGAKYTKISTSEKDENSKDSNISKFIRTIIEKMRLVIFIDELDEIHPSARKKFETQMRQFTLIDHKSIIVATCRSGDYSRIIESFDVVEIMPLSDIEI
jgi:predicted NACHT family NTPase